MGTAVGAWAFKLNVRTRRAEQSSKFNLNGRKSTNELKEAKRDFSLRGPTFRRSGRAEKRRPASLEMTGCGSDQEVARDSNCRSSEALEDAGGAHAAADAHGDHAVAGVAALEFANERGGEFCAGAAEGMAESDGAAVGIDAGSVEASLLDDG